MIQVVTLGAETAKVTAQLAGDDVVVLAFVCPSREAAGRLLGAIDRRLGKCAARLNARTPVAAPEPPADPFPVGAPVKVSTYAWDHGETSIDAVVLRRLSPDRLLVRTRMWRLAEVDQRDLERGQRAG